MRYLLPLGIVLVLVGCGGGPTSPATPKAKSERTPSPPDKDLPEAKTSVPPTKTEASGKDSTEPAKTPGETLKEAGDSAKKAGSALAKDAVDSAKKAGDGLVGGILKKVTDVGKDVKEKAVNELQTRLSGFDPQIASLTDRAGKATGETKTQADGLLTQIGDLKKRLSEILDKTRGASAEALPGLTKEGTTLADQLGEAIRKATDLLGKP